MATAVRSFASRSALSLSFDPTDAVVVHDGGWLAMRCDFALSRRGAERSGERSLFPNLER